MNKATVEQEVLCDYCKNYHDSSMGNCEGTKCVEMQERYFEEHDIFEDSPPQLFRDINIGDTVYYISKETILPRLHNAVVTSIALVDEKIDLNITYNNHTELIKNIKPNEDNKKCAFVKKEDATKYFETVCTNRIVEIAKELGKER